MKFCGDHTGPDKCEGSDRAKAVSVTVYEHSSNFAPTYSGSGSGNKSGQILALAHSLGQKSAQERTIRPTYYQAQKIAQNCKSLGFAKSTEGYALALPLLDHMQARDPEGFYFAETKELDYPVANVPQGRGRVITRIIIIPSWIIKFQSCFSFAAYTNSRPLY